MWCVCYHVRAWMNTWRLNPATIYIHVLIYNIYISIGEFQLSRDKQFCASIVFSQQGEGKWLQHPQTTERKTRPYSNIVTIIIIMQPLCPVVGRSPQHAASKLACHVLSSEMSFRSSIYSGRLSTAWLVSLIVFSCHMVSKW